MRHVSLESDYRIGEAGVFRRRLLAIAFCGFYLVCPVTPWRRVRDLPPLRFDDDDFLGGMSFV